MPTLAEGVVLHFPSSKETTKGVKQNDHFPKGHKGPPSQRGKDKHTGGIKHSLRRQTTRNQLRVHIETTIPQQHHTQPRVCGKADTTHKFSDKIGVNAEPGENGEAQKQDRIKQTGQVHRTNKCKKM